MSNQGEKLLPLRRLEAPIHKFIKVAIPTDLERLRKHQMNIEKYQRCKQWDRLHQEHINASRTVQQLRANLREMETLCGRVRREDARALEKLVQPIREHASKAAHDFLKLHAETANVQPAAPPAPPTNSEEALGGGPTAQGLVSGSEEDKGPEPAQVQLQLPEIPQDQNAAESWESLEEDLLELNGLVNEFSELVHSQQEKIDSIEDHVSAAAANVEEGSQSLGKGERRRLVCRCVRVFVESAGRVWPQLGEKRTESDLRVEKKRG
ncbi:syntaxin-17 isoform X2 [Scleropages formosus]|uniref:syntaxin-17 isoform X2 n=1 Tax=Scleropages formosus TaxID=113540 RepID=UPI0010FAB624|nr:syntaxin-17 isoform X2 [Scleropages formosus]